MNNLPFDLTKLNVDTIRITRRKRIITWSLIPSLVLLVAALSCILPYVANQQVLKHYNQHDYSAAYSLGKVAFMVVPIRYLAYYNRATLETQLGQYNTAITDYQRALAYAPDTKLCMIRQNFVLNFEAQGDDYKNRSMPNEAVAAYSKALAAIADAPSCFSGRNDEQRIAKKKQDAQANQTNQDKTKKPSNDGAKPQPDEPPTNQQEQQLQQLEQSAAERQKENTQNYHYTDPGNVKQW